jgi:glycosyltransferase involved in cell wall biosynthesis
MRILYLITLAERGGAQVHLADLLRGFSGACDIALGTGETNGFLWDVARSLNIEVFRIPNLVHPMRPFADCKAVRETLQVIRQFKPDLIHAHTSKAGMIGRSAGYLSGVPVVFTVHAWGFASHATFLRRITAAGLEFIAARTKCQIIAVCEANRQLGLRYRVARMNKIVTVWNGIGEHSYRPKRDAGICPQIVMVARFVPQKDHATLIRALEGITIPFRLTFVGDGPLRAAIEEQARCLRERVAFLGERTDIVDILDDSDLLVLTSRTEGLPLCVLEGMRAGLPVIATDTGGIKEAVVDGYNGFLVPVGDTETLHAKLLALLTDAGLRQRMGHAGRMRYEKDFTVNRMLVKTAAVYKNILPIQLSERLVRFTGSTDSGA